jgi:hypothetical protein
MSRLRTTLALGLIALLALPAVAGAHPGQRGFAQTFPYASALCMKVTNGHTPKRLQGSTDKVATACAKLKSDFTDAQNAWTTGVAPLRQQATDAIKALRATCQQARANHDPATCKAARLSTRTTIQGLRGQVKQLATAYHTSVQTARKTFWDTIRALRGGSTVTPDPSVGPAPTVKLPSDSQVTG